MLTILWDSIRASRKPNPRVKWPPKPQPKPAPKQKQQPRPEVPKPKPPQIRFEPPPPVPKDFKTWKPPWPPGVREQKGNSKAWWRAWQHFLGVIAIGGVAYTGAKR
ncbi:MAG: hypothetical protein AAF420_01415, partial [Pseudomonadota bacterium]